MAPREMAAHLTDQSEEPRLEGWAEVVKKRGKTKFHWFAEHGAGALCSSGITRPNYIWPNSQVAEAGRCRACQNFMRKFRSNSKEVKHVTQQG